MVLLHLQVSFPIRRKSSAQDPMPVVAAAEAAGAMLMAVVENPYRGIIMSRTASAGLLLARAPTK
jgi:hypothetical protein